MKVAYIPGPGDIAGTYQYWKNGADDPAIPVRAYSAMFFDACRDLGAEGLVFQRGETRGSLVEEDHVSIRSVPAPGHSGILSYWKAKHEHAAACLDVLNAQRPDAVVLGGDFFWPLLPRLRAACGRVVLSVHNTFWPMGTAPASKARIGNAVLGRLFRRNVSAAITVSEECKRQFLSLAEKPVELVRPQIKPETMEMGPAAAPQDPLILFVGRVEADKGVFDLLEAFEQAFSSERRMRLAFAGSGGALDELERRAASSPAAGRVAVLGRLNGEEVNAMLRASSILVCPTQPTFPEGFAVVCAEAMAHGVPCIVSSAVPAADLLDDAAETFPAGDAAALAALLRSAILDSGKFAAMKAAAVERRKCLRGEHHSWGSAVTRILQRNPA